MKRFNGKVGSKKFFKIFQTILILCHFHSRSFSFNSSTNTPSFTCTHTHAHTHPCTPHIHTLTRTHSFKLFLMKQIRNRLRKVPNFFQTLKILCNLEWSRNWKCSQSFASLMVLITLQSVMQQWFLHSLLILSLLMLFYPLSDRVHYEQI